MQFYFQTKKSVPAFLKEYYLVISLGGKASSAHNTASSQAGLYWSFEYLLNPWFINKPKRQKLINSSSDIKCRNLAGKSLRGLNEFFPSFFLDDFEDQCLELWGDVYAY